MKKVLFFTQNRWAFGSIHHGLCKELYKHKIFAQVLDEDLAYTDQEFNFFNNTYDLIVTNPDKVINFHEKSKIPLKKIIAVAHGQWDILLASRRDFYSELHSFGVISNELKEKCTEWCLPVPPKVTEIGIHFDVLYEPPSSQLRRIGYSGAKHSYNYYGQEIKRGHLVEQACDKISNISLQPAINLNHICMPSYYKTVDSVIMTSIEEGGGLPMLECAAAGRLPIGTPVGYFKENAINGGGIILPLQESDLISTLTCHINYYKNNDAAYRDKCMEVQAYARDNYDWSKKIHMWIDLFE